jgi:2-polyprenyl-3-methyl-5-hydroxy-6-metoxy-1,4-benzoquinol methylase
MDRELLLMLWQHAITQNNYNDPHDAVIAELSAYYEMDPEEVRKRCINWEDESVEQWHAKDRSTPQKIVEFFQTQTSWIFDTMRYHADQCVGTEFPQSVEIAYGLRDFPKGTLLDFGGGPGTSGLFFHDLGWKIAIADISTSFQEFAKWRLNLHDVPAEFYNTSKDRLPPDAFNVITAFDVIVHIPDIPTTLAELKQSLQAGGLLIFNIDNRPLNNPRTEYHFFEHHYPIIRHMRAAGFRRVHKIHGGFYVYQKAERSSLVNHVLGVLDHLRYSKATYSIGQLYRWIKIRLTGRV